jgi:hypothetical protein
VFLGVKDGKAAPSVEINKPKGPLVTVSKRWGLY